MVHIIDTHALVWFLEGNRRLSAAARNVLSDVSAQLVLPTLVLAEAAYLYARKRDEKIAQSGLVPVVW
jgi:PIN domain nuclease of toxin-antitoxin system